MTAHAPARAGDAAAPPPGLAAYLALHGVLVPAVLVSSALALQRGPLDLALAGLFYDAPAGGFVWSRSILLDVLGHQAARGLPVLVAGISIAFAVLSCVHRRFARWRGVLLAMSTAMLLAPLLIAWLKWQTSQHCPSDIAEFGGIVQYAVDQAQPLLAAEQPVAGHCLPSAHAGGGYALLSLYSAGWAAGRPEWRWAGLAIGIGAGLVFSLVRMMQGAHFASATVWSATIDWTVCALVFLPVICRRDAASGQHVANDPRWLA